MSSPLDGRIRKLAREELAALSQTAPAAVLETTGPDRLDGLEKEVASLRATVEELAGRLDALEKAAASTASPRRTARRESSE